MKYIIIRWDEENRTYCILHYSHNYEDAISQFEKYNIHCNGAAQLLIDIDDARALTFRDELIRLQEEVRKAREKYESLPNLGMEDSMLSDSTGG
jgi:hypothetical protein